VEWFTVLRRVYFLVELIPTQSWPPSILTRRFNLRLGVGHQYRRKNVFPELNCTRWRRWGHAAGTRVVNIVFFRGPAVAWWRWTIILFKLAAGGVLICFSHLTGNHASLSRRSTVVGGGVVNWCDSRRQVSSVVDMGKLQLYCRSATMCKQ